MEARRYIKIIASLGLALAAVSLVVIRSSPATGFEVSIYSGTPPIVWAFLVLNIIFGIGIVVHQVSRKDHERHNQWVLGLSLILLSYIIILSLHILRGYALWCPWDPLTHLGKIQDIIATGHIEPQNVYPITHIYLAGLSQLWNVNPIVLYKWIPVLFALLYVVFMYFFARSVLPNKGQVILATVASLTLVQGSYLNLTPNHLSTLALPLTLFILAKSFTSRVQWSVLLVLIIILFPPFHPVSSFIFLVVMLTIPLPGKILAISAKKTPDAVNDSFGLKLPVALLLFVWLITWFSSFYIWESTIRNTYTLLTEGGLNRLSLMTQQIEYAEGYGYSVLEYFLKTYGGIVVYIILTLVAFPVLWKRMLTNTALRKLGSLYGPLAVVALAAAGFFFVRITAFGPTRMVAYIVLISTIFVGFVLYEILEKVRHSHRTGYLYKLTPLLIAVLLIGLSMHGMLRLYPAPYTRHTNWQITQTQIDGMDWLLHNNDTTVPISTGLTIPVKRFADFLLSPEERRQQQGIILLQSEFTHPFHFGYDKHATLGESYDRDVYMVLDEKDKLKWAEVFPEMAEFRFYPGDFNKVEHDISVDKLYSNGSFDIYYVHSRASPLK